MIANDSPSLNGPIVVLCPLMKVTVVATEVVEVQVRVMDEGPGVNTRGLVIVGRAEGRNSKILSLLPIHNAIYL